MAAGAPQGDFKLVLTGVNPANQAATVTELMDILQLDQKLTTGIVTSAAQGSPVVLLDGLSRAQAAHVRTYLARLLKLGAQLSLSAEPVGQAKRIPWPAPPPITRRPANLFVCPACGERFVVQRWQPVPAPVAAPGAVAPGPAPAPAPPPIPPSAAPAIPEAVAVEAEPLEAIAEGVPAEAVEPLTADELPVAEIEPEDDLPVAEALPAEPIPVEAAPPAPAPKPAPAPRPAPPVARPAVPVAQPVQPAARPAKPAAPAARPVPQAKPAPRPAAAKPAPAPAPAAPDAPGARYDVSVARVPGPRQGKLADLLVDRGGLPPDEAERQVRRTVVLVCKGGSSAEADDWRKALLGIGLKPRIRKK